MRQFEFEERVKMQVSQKEYEAIEVVYMNSDLDKDEFCKMWVKMNKSRVERAIEAEKKRQEKEEEDWKLYAILHKESDVSDFAVNLLTRSEVKLLEKVGITLRVDGPRYESYPKCMSTVRYEIMKHLAIV